MKKLTITLTDEGALAYRGNAIGQMGSDRELSDSQSLMRGKRLMQGAAPKREIVQHSPESDGSKRHAALVCGFRAKNAERFIDKVTVEPA